MKPLPRRAFLKTSALAATGAVLGARAWSQVPGANGDLRVAILGMNGRGRNLLAAFKAVPGVRIAALCDVDSAVLERVKASAPEAKLCRDLREVLAAPDVDAIAIATPNHWHALAGIWACQAGKDVLVEKPVSHCIWEGRQLVAAAEKHGRIVQAGTQIRSGAGLQEAVQWVRAGHLGRITLARGFCYKRRRSIGLTPGPQPVPAAVDYDLWLGPAADAPLRRTQFHYDWHWQTPYGNGDLGNQGAHQMDVARWFLGEAGLPRHTLSVGGRLGYADDGDTPNTQVVVHDYATAPLIFEVRGLPARPDPAGAPSGDGRSTPADAATMDKHEGVSIGNIIECEGGRVVTTSYFVATAYDRDGKVVKEFRGEDRLVRNFVEAVRSRRPADLCGPIGEGHVSSALCHLGSISHQAGRATPAGELRERIKGNAPLAEACGRMLEHLAVNGVEAPLTLGQPLAIDAAAERFTGPGADRANALLKDAYRAPFTVPQVA